MDAQVKGMISGYVTAYESYKGLLDAEALVSLKALHDETQALAEKAADYMAFVQAASQKNIFGRWTEEMTKAGEALQKQRKEKPREVTIDAVLGQYRALANDAKNRPHNERTVAAYERFLALGAQAANPLTMFANLEEAGYVLALSTAGIEDSNQLQYDRTDPNETLYRAYYAECLEVARTSKTNEDVIFRMDAAALAQQETLSRDQFIYFVLTMLFGGLLDFTKLKRNLRSGLPDIRMGLNSAPKSAVDFLAENATGLLVVRDEIRLLHRYLTETLGFDCRSLAIDYRRQKMVLNQGQPLSATSRVWESMDPANLAWFAETLYEEALSDLSPVEILRRPLKQPFQPIRMPEDETRDNIGARVASRAQELVRDFAWAND
jgi:hypothetical protein